MPGVVGLVTAWRIVYTPQAAKDAKKLKRSGLKPKAEALLEILRSNPFQSPPPFEKLVGDLAGVIVNLRKDDTRAYDPSRLEQCHRMAGSEAHSEGATAKILDRL